MNAEVRLIDRDAAIDCPDCGAAQRTPPLASGTAAECRRCGRLLRRRDPATLTSALLLALSSLLLLLPANLLPLMRAGRFGLESSVTLASATAQVFEEWPLLAVLFALATIAAPVARAALMVAALASLRFGVRGRWVGRTFRYALALRHWAMADVLIIALFVTFMRTNALLRAEILWGGWCLLGAVALLALTSVALARADVWRALLPDPPIDSLPPDTVACTACGWLAAATAAGTGCERCGLRLHARRPDALSRATALVAAGYMLYFPSYYYPMSITLRPDGVERHTILDGMQRLAHAGFWYLGALIFVVSVLIPLLKLVALTWLIVRAHLPSARGLVLRTRLYRVIRHIGRWSSTDPFIVAMNAGMLSFGGVISVRAGPAALPFALVVVITMLAAQSFDPRLEWDAAEAAGLDVDEAARPR